MRNRNIVNTGRICIDCMNRPQATMAILMDRLNYYIDKSRKVGAICSNCSQHKQHVIIHHGYGINVVDNQVEEKSAHISSISKDVYSHIFKPAENCGKNQSSMQAIDIENCQSLDCAIYFEKIKLSNRYEELINLIEYAEVVL